jgi:protein tyrosine phosphatase (PTP) superfamily phosphohydrolase (DUF442 family)
MTIDWPIPGSLARSSRPGRGLGRDAPVDIATVDAWIAEAMAEGVRSIICLLGDDQLPLYAALPDGLIAYYRAAKFTVAHVPSRDHANPPLSREQLDTVRHAYRELPKPVLVHCSAGCSRTGEAVRSIQMAEGGRSSSAKTFQHARLSERE